jgi:hypothetical protein
LSIRHCFALVSRWCAEIAASHLGQLPGRRYAVAAAYLHGAPDCGHSGRSGVARQRWCHGRQHSRNIHHHRDFEALRKRPGRVGRDGNSFNFQPSEANYTTYANSVGKFAQIAKDRGVLSDPSERVIRRHSGKFIANFGNEIAREALLEDEPPPATNVVPLSGGVRR